MTDTITIKKPVPVVEVDAEKQASIDALNEAIPDKAAEIESTDAAPNEPLISDAKETLKGLFQLIPIVLSISGLKHSAAVWTESTCETLSSRSMPVLKKYALGQKIIKFLEAGSGIEEVALITALIPLSMSVYSAYGKDKQEANAAAEIAEAVKSPVTVTVNKAPIDEDLIFKTGQGLQ